MSIFRKKSDGVPHPNLPKEFFEDGENVKNNAHTGQMSHLFNLMSSGNYKARKVGLKNDFFERDLSKDFNHDKEIFKPLDDING